MSYAVRNDGAGWRAVDGPEDCMSNEYWQAEQPPLVGNDASTVRAAEIKAELLAIDAKTPRAMRESAVTGDTSRLVELEAQAVKLRAELATLT